MPIIGEVGQKRGRRTAQRCCARHAVLEMCPAFANNAAPRSFRRSIVPNISPGSSEQTVAGSDETVPIPHQPVEVCELSWQGTLWTSPEPLKSSSGVCPEAAAIVQLTTRFVSRSTERPLRIKYATNPSRSARPNDQPRKDER